MDRDKTAREARRNRIVRLVMPEEIKRRDQEKAEREALKSTPEYIRWETTRKMLQDCSKSEAEAYIIMAQATEKLSDAIYEFITTEIDFSRKLNIGEYFHKEVSFADIETIINQCLVALNKLRALSENEKVQAHATGKKFNEFERLMTKLVDLDARFALFAPKKVLNKAKFMDKVKDLPAEYRDDIFALKDRLDIDEKDDNLLKYIVAEFDPREERTVAVTKMMDEEKEAEEKALKVMEKTGESLIDDIYMFFKTELNLQEGVLNDVEHVAIQKIFEICLDPIKRLKKVTVELDSFNSRAGKNSMYDKLFERLIKLDIKFALYATKNALSRYDLDFKQLNEQEKDIVFAKIQKYGLWKDPEYVVVYHSVFAGQIAKQNTDGVQV